MHDVVFSHVAEVHFTQCVQCDAPPCQECGDHATEREQTEVFEKFMKPLKLDKDFKLTVSGSYWTVWRYDRVDLLTVAHEPFGSIGNREFQRAQVLEFRLRSSNSASVRFINLHLPSSKGRSLSNANRKLHLMKAVSLAGTNGLIMGDLNTKCKDRRPLPRQHKSSF